MISLPTGRMQPIGYVLMSFGVRDNRPVAAYDEWVRQIPKVYREVVLGQKGGPIPALASDPLRLAALRHNRSLLPLAMTARKPMFKLKTADGARGAHLDAVRQCYADFEALARRIADIVGEDVGA